MKTKFGYRVLCIVEALGSVIYLNLEQDVWQILLKEGGRRPAAPILTWQVRMAASRHLCRLSAP